MSPTKISTPAAFVECFGYLTTCHCCFLCRSLAHTLIQNKNMWRIYGNFHFWYMQEVLRLVGISLCLPDMEKLSYPSMTCPLKPWQTSAIFMFHAAPRTNCWKGPSFSVEAAGESLSLERKSHGWIRIRAERVCLALFDSFYLLSHFCFALVKTAKLQSAWSTLRMYEKCFKFHKPCKNSINKTSCQVDGGAEGKYWIENDGVEILITTIYSPKSDEIIILSSAKWSTNPLHGNPSKHRCFEMLWANSHGCICVILYRPIVIYNLDHIIRLPFLFDTADTGMEYNGMKWNGCVAQKGMFALETYVPDLRFAHSCRENPSACQRR